MRRRTKSASFGLESLHDLVEVALEQVPVRFEGCVMVAWPSSGSKTLTIHEGVFFESSSSRFGATCCVVITSRRQG